MEEIGRLMYTATNVAKAAGKFLRQSFGTAVDWTETSAHDVKVRTDVVTQELIVRGILKEYPDHRILGEEGMAGDPDGEIEWVVDPLDGTLNFAYGIPHFAVSIAARVTSGRFLLGVVYDPIREEMFTVMEGSEAFLNGEAIHASRRQGLEEAVCIVGFARSPEGMKKGLEWLHYYAPRVRKIRLTGSAALDLAYVAAGRVDAYLEAEIRLWDIAAGSQLVLAAGGKLRLLPLDWEKHLFSVEATNGAIPFPKGPIANQGETAPVDLGRGRTAGQILGSLLASPKSKDR
ncbi:inositol monophosphatase family protein [Candidatus Methylacidithermus pantelleriae]|uniref:Inositol-1-monophosphatase n=1 Tax=Candidatus Methylacidithermus pantelleriae TaxID=2744239 RepID=A0A8J2BFP7_9BACT|nr:inositol monophosphatase family protein [Candidatus Methylacidithermus pantelleriae]CAF0689247.1 Inositol-1-monophosphatase [Candidatus Methylacidithermus pantelleriae]